MTRTKSHFHQPEEDSQDPHLVTEAAAVQMIPLIRSFMHSKKLLAFQEAAQEEADSTVEVARACNPHMMRS